MKVIDIIFALVSGAMVSEILYDFLRGYGVSIGIYTWLVLIALPVLSLLFLWLAYVVGRRLLIVLQAAKHLLVGAFATVIDLKIFEFLAWIFSFNLILPKGISFLLATSIKYLGNKQWAFEKPERDGIAKEIFQFFIVTVVGMSIDIAFFFYFVNIMGPQFQTPEYVWVKLSVILSALVAAVWNFLGYKFLVFNK